MKDIIITVGIPASGKSTYSRELVKKHGALHLSSDDIRNRMKEATGEWTHAEVFKEMRSRLFEAVEDELAPEIIIYDATNTSRKRRRSLYRDIKQEYPDVHVEIKFFSVSAYDAMSRNYVRKLEERVPKEVIWRMHKNLQVPRIEVDCDSFEVLGDAIFDKGDFKSYNDLFMKVIGMGHSLEMLGNMEGHDCAPWHLETIEEHLNMAFRNADDDLKEVALMHDLGKGFCKEVDETGYATYRGHENLSSHYFLNYLALTKYKGKDIPEFELENAEVILRHMQAHQGLGVKNIRNNKLNNNVIDKLNKFTIIDKKSRITEGDLYG